jgi:hypothetical protein
MTDQPNPVGLTKEISGHPTDHSRKVLLCALCGRPETHDGLTHRQIVDFSDLVHHEFQAECVHCDLPIHRAANFDIFGWLHDGTNRAQCDKRGYRAEPKVE